MKKGAWLLYIILLFSLPFNSKGQSCSTTSRANTIVPDKLCSPVEVDWDVSYTGVNNLGTKVEILFEWDDGGSEVITATEGPAGTFYATATHTYLSIDDQCNYHPLATLIVNGDVCESTSQEQIVTVWDTDDENGGRVEAAPNVYPVCVGNGATMHFDDGTRFNCVPPQENDVPNVETRWIQFVYGTRNTMSSSTPVSVDGYTGPWPYYGPVITLPGPVTGSSEQSLPITVADDNLVGEEFEVELRYWNYCNPYPSDPPETDRSVIRIVDNPDATITPVDTMCEFNTAINLDAATGGGTWSGNGIINATTGLFAPYEAGTGDHTILYQVTDGNGCSDSDTETITVRGAPDADITPVDNFCLYDAPYDLQATPSGGTWSGPGITDVILGTFDPVVAGVGTHGIAYISDTDAYGCTGMDSIELHVADLPFAEFLTPDSAWCEEEINQSVAEILISGADTSTFDLIMTIRGTIDTLFNLPVDTFTLFLNNQAGKNEYTLRKVIEHHGDSYCEVDLSDTLVMDVHPLPDMTVVHNDDICSPAYLDFTAVAGYESYLWDFNDGIVRERSVNIISHTFEFSYKDHILEIIEGDTIYDLTKSDSIFPFQLSIYTEYGCYDQISDSIEIHLSPTANFFVNPKIQEYPESEIYLINLTSPGLWSYYWDFGDGQTDTAKDPNEHVYSTWGFYDIDLTSYSPYCRDSTTQRIQIQPPPPISSFFPDSVGCPPLEISFTNTSDYADTYLWDFDDGRFSTEKNPTHLFYQSKEHHVKLIAYGLSGIDTSEQVVFIYETPQPLFSVYPAEARNLTQLFKFTNNTIDGSYYLWDFGDGNTSAEEEPTHVYGEEGTFTITLYAWSENDCVDTLVKESLITIIAGEGSTDFPNAFVWNGERATGGHWTDGEIDNTVFHPVFENAVGMHMMIYTRWGEMIWETDDLYTGWDGYLKSGELAKPGVYVYKASVTFVDGTRKDYVGDVTFLH